MMPKRGVFIGFVVALLLSGLVAGLAPMTNAQQTGTATLTIHSRFCPPGYDGTDIYNTCHDTIGDQSQEFQLWEDTLRVERSKQPDAEGNITFADLETGGYAVTSSIPANLVNTSVYCTWDEGNGRWLNRSWLTDDGWEAFSVPIGVGEQVLCDWYTIPIAEVAASRASITIHNRFCPPDYTNFGNESNDCHDTVGFSGMVLYALSGPTPQTENLESGNVTFSWLDPGTYDIRLETHTVYEFEASAYCSTMDAVGVPFLTTSIAPGDTLTFRIDPGDEVICDWYMYPTSAFYQTGADTPISVIACETRSGLGLFMGGLPDGCFRVEGVDIAAYPTAAGPSFAQRCTTGQPGGCRVYLPVVILLSAEIDESDLPDGYALLEKPITWFQYGEGTGLMIQVNPIDASSKGD
jgi:hypothetical protein